MMWQMFEIISILVVIKLTVDVLGYYIIKIYWKQKGCITDTFEIVVNNQGEIVLPEDRNRFIRLWMRIRQEEFVYWYCLAYRVMLKIDRYFLKNGA